MVESSVFKLLISAIVTIALLFLFFQYILPYFLGETQVSEKIQEQLQGAEIKLGTYLGESFRQVAPTTLTATLLDTGNRSIVFACNDSKLCCLKGEVCSKNIEWDERLLKLKKGSPIQIGVRCREQELIICKTYVGVIPGQFKIELKENLPEINLSQSETFVVNFTVKNTGKSPSRGKVNLELFKEFTINRQIQTEFMETKELEEFDLFANEEQIFSASISVKENGVYQLKVKVQETTDETNYSEESLKFTGQGQTVQTACQTGMKTIQEDTGTGKCKINYACIDCSFGFQCQQVWAEQGKIVTEIDKENAFEIVEKTNNECVLN
ncbi:MAG: hypothetical protein Q7S92_04070 [Candidatus Diapherotrites archaeon]|nr:hypothetical protein [Candidatus Diapherotrites archaeon]